MEGRRSQGDDRANLRRLLDEATRFADRLLIKLDITYDERRDYIDKMRREGELDPLVRGSEGSP